MRELSKSWKEKRTTSTRGDQLEDNHQELVMKSKISEIQQFNVGKTVTVQVTGSEKRIAGGKRKMIRDKCLTEFRRKNKKNCVRTRAKMEESLFHCDGYLKQVPRSIQGLSAFTASPFLQPNDHRWR